MPDHPRSRHFTFCFFSCCTSAQPHRLEIVARMGVTNLGQKKFWFGFFAILFLLLSPPLLKHQGKVKLNPNRQQLSSSTSSLSWNWEYCLQHLQHRLSCLASSLAAATCILLSDHSNHCSETSPHTPQPGKAPDLHLSSPTPVPVTEESHSTAIESAPSFSIFIKWYLNQFVEEMEES